MIEGAGERILAGQIRCQLRMKPGVMRRPGMANEEVPPGLPARNTTHRKQGKKRRCQVPQVDITELSDFLKVTEAIYSLYSFLADNDDQPTSL
jgi:hypothetical protein